MVENEAKRVGIRDLYVGLRSDVIQMLPLPVGEGWVRHQAAVGLMTLLVTERIAAGVGTRSGWLCSRRAAVSVEVINRSNLLRILRCHAVRRG